ncbi:META domain-containing protein [Echinicola marina]|uniref:META domain-containing protein n=1 Tax=Echinicola marina TaxID=2859768 RepID=UPI001CF716B7|nr:META domain-containing protein [Echinicola marina]UCS94646.1 META domain-containing protein [Echinicola marina]
MKKVIYLSFFCLLGMASCSKKNIPAKSENNQEMSVQDKDFNIDFKASGNEPFWSLKIDFDKKMVFNTLSGYEIITPVPEPIRIQDVNGLSYRAETEKGSLYVTIIRSKCQDTMADKESDYQVSIQTKLKSENEYQEYRGCGNYQGDYRLNDIWALESINGEKLFEGGKAPNIEFNLRENRFYGFGGCNRINGSFSLGDQKIKFGKALSTMMACPKMEEEGIFTAKINDQEYTYQIQEGKLRLCNRDNELVFRKID